MPNVQKALLPGFPILFDGDVLHDLLLFADWLETSWTGMHAYYLSLAEQIAKITEPFQEAYYLHIYLSLV